MFKKIGGIISIIFIIISFIFVIIFFRYPQIFSKYIPNSSVQNVVLPEGFPDIPEYPKAKLTSQYDEEMEGEIKYQYQAAWETDKSVPEVMNWYMNSKNKDWKVVTPTSDPGATGAQDAVFEYADWKIYVVVQKRDIGDPTFIYVSVDPK